MQNVKLWAELLKFALELKFLEGYRTTLGVIGFVGLALWSLFGLDPPNYEQAVAAIAAVLAILGIKPQPPQETVFHASETDQHPHDSTGGP